MEKMPSLKTARLVLRPFKLEDAKEVTVLASDKEIVMNTENLPYPYEEYMARNWINSHQNAYDHGGGLTLGITLRKGNVLMGAIGLDIEKKYDHAELGYWLGRPFWGNGYATEATRRMLHHAFTELKLHRVHACSLTRTPASRKILEKKLGMQHEGCWRQHIKKWDNYEDVDLFGILRSEYKY